MNSHIKELERLKAVNRFLLFDKKKEIQQIAKLASAVTGTPLALITLMDKEEQIILASEGIYLEKMPRKTSFCNYAIEEDDVMVIEDATKDDRFKDFPVVTGDFNIRFYASANLNSDDGYKIGTLCVYDTKPNHITDQVKEYLKILAQQVDHILELDEQLRLSDEKNRILRNIAWVHANKISGPLTSIMGMIDLIKYDNYNFNPEYLALLEKAAQQLEKEVNQIISSTTNNNLD